MDLHDEPDIEITLQLCLINQASKVMQEAIFSINVCF